MTEHKGEEAAEQLQQYFKEHPAIGIFCCMLFIVLAVLLPSLAGLLIGGCMLYFILTS